MIASPLSAQRQPMAILDTEKVQGSYYFRYDELGAHSEAPPHSHRWGHLNYASHGSLNMDVPTGHILCPPQHGVWIPPGLVHSCYLKHAVQYRSVYLAPELCRQLPTVAGCMPIGGIVKAILLDFGSRGVQVPSTAADLRLAQVVHDQLCATPLELLFDLSFVVDIALAASQLHHGVMEHHTGPALAGFVAAFSAIWWAWMNYTWFASAYDDDSAVFRLLTMLQMVGVLIFAAGVPGLFNGDFRAGVLGYAVMRLALVVQWLLAARGDPACAATCPTACPPWVPAGVPGCGSTWRTAATAPAWRQAAPGPWPTCWPRTPTSPTLRSTPPTWPPRPGLAFAEPGVIQRLSEELCRLPCQLRSGGFFSGL